MKRKLLLTLILFLFITVNIKSQDSNYYFTGEQVKKLRLIVLERDFLKIEVDSLNNRCELYRNLNLSNNLIIAMQDTVIAIKERQLKIFENTPQITQVIKKTGFLTWVGVIVSSLAGGLVIGYVLK